jgi:hypothetical protein
MKILIKIKTFEQWKTELAYQSSVPKMLMKISSIQRKYLSKFLFIKYSLAIN